MERQLFLEKLKSAGDEKTILHMFPLGVDGEGEIVFAYNQEKGYFRRQICVSGAKRTAYIVKELSLLDSLSKKRETAFVILSPKREYSEVLRLKNADVTFPYLRSKKDFSAILDGFSPLFERIKTGKSVQETYFVLDGLEELDGGDTWLKLYMAFFEKTDGLNVNIITGVDFKKTAFCSNPQLFVGVKNSLLTTDEDGEADVTKVLDGGEMTLPKQIIYPREKGDTVC